MEKFNSSFVRKEKNEKRRFKAIFNLRELENIVELFFTNNEELIENYEE